jgi:hypothetical protein
MDISRIKLNDEIDDHRQLMDSLEIELKVKKRRLNDTSDEYIKLSEIKRQKILREVSVWKYPEFQGLPDEIILSIIEFMPINSICKFNSTCKKFQFTGKEIKIKLLKKVFEKMDIYSYCGFKNQKLILLEGWLCNHQRYRIVLIISSENDILKQLNYFVEIMRSGKLNNKILLSSSYREKYQYLDLFNEYLKKRNIFELFGEVKY